MADTPHIAELPKQVADKIAAGEVIDRPVSIVKELIENSIDAGSTSIVVEIKNGGKSYIRVTDNGCGIHQDETELAFKRHATSKLRNVKDLDAIGTLGFRGEALASIAAVSRTELITRTADRDTGTHLVIEGGITVQNTGAGCPVGTTIVVRDLFFNTPARLKFMKKDNTESALIIDFISKAALAYPGIRIRLINNETSLFSTPGRNDRLAAISTVYSSSLAKKLMPLVEVSGVPEGISLTGYISPPSFSAVTRKNQIYFVNGRYIQSKILDTAVAEGYREKMFEGRYPHAYIFLTVPGEFLDVNIHPNKKEIRFDDDVLIRDLVARAIRETLRMPGAVGDIRFKKDSQTISPKSGISSPVNNEKTVAAPDKKSSQDNLKLHSTAAPAEKNRVKVKTEQIDIHNLLKAKRQEAENRPVEQTKVAESASAYKVDNDAAKDQSKAPVKERETILPEIKAPERIPFDVKAIRPVGAIFATYILGCDNDTFYMIDQHAAHERVFYEKFTRQFYGQQVASQMLAIPLKIEVSAGVSSAQEEWIDFIGKSGFEIESFGPRTYAVKAIPAYMSLSEAQDFINDFTESIGEPGIFRDRKRLDKIITRSCKSAVKGNDRLDDLEIRQLLKDLSECINPFSCPHGRPTIIRMKKSEIEGLFKR